MYAPEGGRKEEIQTFYKYLQKEGNQVIPRIAGTFGEEKWK
jgi:hypothetical protein